MNFKKFLKLKEHRLSLSSKTNAMDSVLILDGESVNIFKANGISLDDICKFLNIKSLQDKNYIYSFWDSGGKILVDDKTIDHILKILSMSKNDLAYIISKIKAFRKVLNLSADCYFATMLIKLENTCVFTNELIIRSSKDSNGNVNYDFDANSDLSKKIEKATALLTQILNMVDINLTVDMDNNSDVDCRELFKNVNSNIVNVDQDVGIAFNDSGVVMVLSNYVLNNIIAGDSDVAIKLYEDLLVGYRHNKDAAVYYSQLFAKYIVS